MTLRARNRKRIPEHDVRVPDPQSVEWLDRIAVELPYPLPKLGEEGVALAEHRVGAMDLVAGVGRVIVVMDHTNKHGDSKVLQACTLPLTGTAVVDRIITNLGVLDVVEGGLRIVECAEGVSESDLRAATEATIVD